MSGSSHLTDFTNALQTSADDYGVELDSNSLEGLSRYYEFLNAWNVRLHLVAPTSPQEFATRHILESLMLVHYLDEGSRVADLGSGGGLPILPCLIVRRDIRATLIESSQKKGVFLHEALTHTKVSDRATVIIDRFEDIAAPQVEFVTCRAIERFERLLPHLIEWAPSSATLLLFGGEGLETQIAKTGLIINTDLLPNSESRFLFVVRKRQD